MKIRGWSIDGFGIFHDCAVSDLPDGLTVLHGANEAGKSTLLEFLRRVLFGVPGGGGASPYAPLHGGRHRGRVVVANGSGEVVVERELDRRAPPQLRRPDGSSADVAELPRLLGGADERLFRSVFAFSLDDLRSLATLDAGGVHDALFSAALAGAGRSAQGAARALRGQAAALLDGEGAAQISRLIAELQALHPRLNAARRGALAYAEWRAAADRLAAAVGAERSALTARRAARARAAALLHAWPAWDALQAARSELAGLGSVRQPPPEVAARLHTARQRHAAAAVVAQALCAEQDEAQRRAAALPEDAGSAALAAAVEALAADLPLYRVQRAALPALRQRAAAAQQVLADRLRRAGGWSVERLRAWGGSGVDRDAVRDWQVRLRAAAERAQQAQWRWETAAATGHAARRERNLVAAELPAEPPPEAAVIERQQRQLTELRATIEQMAAHRARGEASVHEFRASERELRGLEARRDPAPPAWLTPLLDAIAVAGGITAIWWLLSGALAAAGGALGAALGAFVAERWTRSLQLAQAGRFTQRQEARQQARSEMETARRNRDAEWHRAAQLAAQVARQAAGLDLARSPTSADLEARDRELTDAAIASARAAQVRASLGELDAVLARCEEEERLRREEVAAGAAARQGLEDEWGLWSRAASFSPAATPDAVLERVTLFDAALAALADADAADHELRQIEPLVEQWETRGRALLARAGVAAAADIDADAVLECVVSLRAQLLEDAPRRARRLLLIEEMRDRAARLVTAEAEVERCQAEVDATLRAAGMRDEAELVRLRELAERLQALQRTVAEREQAVVERLGDEDALAELEEGTVDAWRQRTLRADAEIAAHEQRLFELLAEEQRARLACGALEESAEVASLEAEWAALMAELGAAVRAWRVLAAAEGLIDEARRAFERTRQPAVLRAASATFATVTGGHYEGIAQDEHGQALLVIERDGRRKQAASELSRGTTEQLYLSIRLGLAQELARRGVALPLVMDDVLVHFDPERARCMVEALSAFAREHQVLFFTCHPATRDLLLQHGRAARLVEL